MRRVFMLAIAFAFVCTGFSDEPARQLVGLFGGFLALFCVWEAFDLWIASKKGTQL